MPAWSLLSAGGALQIAAAVRLGTVQLHGAPDAQHPVLGAAAADVGAASFTQAPGDLGTRMRSALAATLQLTPRALLLGTDCESATLVDIDQPADLVHVPKEWLARPTAEGRGATERT